jgi:hypothetical protein
MIVISVRVLADIAMVNNLLLENRMGINPSVLREKLKLTQTCVGIKN